MNQKELAVYFAAVRSDLKVFLQQCFYTLYPGKEFQDNWHIDAIVYALERSIEGKEQRLIINMPPRQLKSMIVSVVFPAFLLGMDPTVKIICVSYGEDLAKPLARDFRRIVESEWYRKVFPNVVAIKSTEGEFVTEAGGYRYSTTVNGTITGRGSDFILIDDPIKPEDANSDTTRNKVNEWFKSTLLSRLEDKKRSVLILVMQRLHVNDLSGFLEADGGYAKLSLPAIAPRNAVIPIGLNRNYQRSAGEPLNTAYESLEVLESIRDQMGPHIFTAQYQQQPERPDGAYIKQKYLQRVSTLSQIKSGGMYWISVDSALSTEKTADFSAISVGYSNEEGHYVLTASRGRWDFEELLKQVMRHYQPERNMTFIVEKAGSGISLLQYLQKRSYPCFSSSPTRDKVERLHQVMSLFLSRRVFLLDVQGKNDWVKGYENELLSFPYGRFDDQVDSLTQALTWAEPRANPGGRVYFLD
ncbi:MAG: terminase [Rhodocyclaceae bacterium]|nr:MAG: terminase [Rhodocyclaceae bacterium]